MKKTTKTFTTVLSVLALTGVSHGFQIMMPTSHRGPLSTSTPAQHVSVRSSSLSSSSSNGDDISSLATSRFPTSPEDQVRQASISLKEATKDGKMRHSIRLLLPIIGATELDDWPGGARQMMEAASPLIYDVMSSQQDPEQQNKEEEEGANSISIQESVIDEADGVRALFVQGRNPKDDSCAVLLPSADTVPRLQEIDEQVGDKRNLVLVNTQWKRKSDFGQSFGFFGAGNKRDEKVNFVEAYEPTFHCSNIMVEGDIVRILRTYPGPWRVYLREVDADDETRIDWVQIGTKDVIESKTLEWEEAAKEGDNDGGKLFDYGIPGYSEIENMITSREGYVPKSLSERAASAFTFIKDTL